MADEDEGEGYDVAIPRENEPHLEDDDARGVDIDFTDAAESKFDSDGVHVSVAPGVVLRGRFSAVEKLGQQIVDHLQQRGQYGGQFSTIQIEITKVMNGFKPPILVEIVSQGTLGGQQFTFTSRAYRRHVKPGGSMISRTLLAVASAMQSAKPGKKLPLQFCLEQCTADICLRLDREAQHSESRAERVYRRLDVGQWIIALLAACYVGWIYRQAHPEQKISDTIFLAGLAGLSSLFVIQGLLGMLTPRSFFYESPRGKREMARQNVESFFAFRLKSIFLAIVFAAIGALVIAGS
jgi:hypothetical protein